MKLPMLKSLGKRGINYWNNLGEMERLSFILDHQGIFLCSDLVKPGELLAAQVAPESAREYIIEREESPFFSFVDIKKTAGKQRDIPRFLSTLEVAIS